MDSRSEKYYNDLNSEETEAPESHSPNRVNFSERLLEKLDTEGRSMAAINVRPFTTFLTRQKIFTVRKRNAYQDRKLTVHNIKGSKQNPLLFNHFKASLPPPPPGTCRAFVTSPDSHTNPTLGLENVCKCSSPGTKRMVCSLKRLYKKSQIQPVRKC